MLRIHSLMFLLSASLMMLETLIIRQWKVLLRFDTLFFVLPLVMLGMAGGAILVFNQAKKLEVIQRGQRGANRWFSLGILGYAFISPVPFLLFSNGAVSYSTIMAAVSCLVLFFLWGYLNSFLFTIEPKQTLGLYVSNLAGTIVGLAVVLAVMNNWGTPSAIAWMSVIATMLALVCFGKQRGIWLLSLMVVGIIAVSLELSFLPSLVRIYSRSEPPPWFGTNSFSQVEMYPLDSAAQLMQALGIPNGQPLARPHDRPTIQAWEVSTDERQMVSTVIRFESLEDVRFLEHDCSYFAFTLGRRKHALILGSGGGLEIIMALLADWQRIEAVEINPLMVSAVQDVGAKGVYDSPKVISSIGDGRRYLRSQNGKYDLIVLPNVKGYGGMGVAGGVFLQNYLLTSEALDLYLDKLNPGGTLVIRDLMWTWDWIWSSVLHGLQKRYGEETWSAIRLSDEDRLKALGKTPLETNGPKRHGGAQFVLMLRRGKFAPDEMARAKQFVEQERFQFAPLNIEEELRASLKPISTDDRPFELRFSRDRFRPFFANRISSGPIERNAPSQKKRLLDTDVLLIVLGSQIGVALALIAALWLFVRRSVPAMDHALLRTAVLYFSALGAGFMAVELVLIEKVVRLLGTPTLSFGLSICALLGGAVIGVPLLRGKDLDRLSKLIAKIALAAPVFIIASYAALEWLGRNSTFPAWLDMAFAVVALVPTGILIGTLFPAALRLLGARSSRWIPWMWAANGIGAIVGSVGTKTVAVLWGFGVAMLVSVTFYLIVTLCSIRFRGSGQFRD